MPVIITVEDLLAARAQGEDLVVLDARQHYTDPSAPRQMWLEARVPGATHLDMATAISGPRRPDGVGGRNPMPTARAFIEGLNGAGARRAARLVAYDQRMEGVAARVWWLGRELDIDIDVLEGGLDAWVAAGEPIESGDPGSRPGPGDLTVPDTMEADTVIGEDGRSTVTADDLMGLQDDVLLLDVRGAARYRGDEEPLDPVGGHIPGAGNVPNIAADGGPTPPSVIAELVAHDGDVIASCGSGVSACLMLLRLAEAGRDDVRLYPGSWSEWLALGLPYATGPSPR